MKDQFDLQEEFFGLFMSDTTLVSQLGIPIGSDISIFDKKIRRIASDAVLLQQELDQSIDALPFFDYSFIPMNGQIKNYLVNKACIEFNIYSANLSDTNEIFKSIKRILNGNYEDTQVYYAGQASSGIQYIYRWMFRVRTLVGTC